MDLLPLCYPGSAGSLRQRPVVWNVIFCFVSCSWLHFIVCMHEHTHTPSPPCAGQMPTGGVHRMVPGPRGQICKPRLATYVGGWCPPHLIVKFNKLIPWFCTAVNSPPAALSSIGKYFLSEFIPIFQTIFPWPGSAHSKSLNSQIVRYILYWIGFRLCSYLLRWCCWRLETGSPRRW